MNNAVKKTAPNTPIISMHTVTTDIVSKASQVILGKDHEIRLALACLLANGHLLIEDLPGVGKTTLAHVLAKISGLNYSRIQFTSDLLPADILGISIFERQTNTFTFHPGPVFSNIILADEINRATPKAQSALLEAMEESQVTIEGETRELPHPFFVIATQNPTYQIGTFPLPESQLDRFHMRIKLGFPSHEAERALLSGEERSKILGRLESCISDKELIDIQKKVQEIFVSEAILDYIQAILAHTRQSPEFIAGLSPRAGLALLSCAKAWSFISGRDHALPDDVQTVLPYVVKHRLRTNMDANSVDSEDAIEQLLNISIP